RRQGARARPGRARCLAVLGLDRRAHLLDGGPSRLVHPAAALVEIGLIDRRLPGLELLALLDDLLPLRELGAQRLGPRIELRLGLRRRREPLRTAPEEKAREPEAGQEQGEAAHEPMLHCPLFSLRPRAVTPRAA